MEFNAAEKNVIDALDYVLHSNGVKVTSKTIRERLYLHPDFPSLVSMTDVLTEWKIPNLASRIAPDQLLEIPLPAIAFIEHDGGYFAPVRKVSLQSGVEWLDTRRGWQKEDFVTFTHNWNGISLLLNADQGSGEANYVQKRIVELRDRLRVPFIILASISLLSIFLLVFSKYFANSSLSFFGMVVTKFFGACISILLLWQSIDSNNNFIRSLCGVDDNNNCNNILKSKAAKLWGLISWSEIGYVYFVGGFVTLLLSSITSSFNLICWIISLNILALPFTFYSVYYQAKIARQWCIFCISIQVVIWVEFAVGFPLWSEMRYTFSNTVLGVWLFSFGLPIVLWMIIKMHLVRSSMVFPLLREIQRTKFNSDYIEILFKKQRVMPPIFEDMLVIKMGNRKAINVLTVVTNLYCRPCAEVHAQLEQLVREYNDIHCQYVFAGSPNSISLAQMLLSMNENEAELAMNIWFHGRLSNKTIWPTTKISDALESGSENQITLHRRWGELANVMATPTIFLNGFEIPAIYSITDISKLVEYIK